MSNLEIKNLSIKIENKIILEKINLEIKKGEILVVIGKNGIGKSSICKAILNDEKIKKTGKILFGEKNLLNLSTEEISNLGIFLSHQTPPQISGLSVSNFLKTIYNTKNKKNLNISQFYKNFKSINGKSWT